MTEEIKTEEKKECKCCECKEKLCKCLKEFLFKAAIVYVGVTLAIITAAKVLQPKCPCKMMKHGFGIERQMQPMMHGDFYRHKGEFKPTFEGKRPDFKKMKHFKAPHNVQKPEFPKEAE